MGGFIEIEAEDGERFRAYKAVPAAGHGPAIILLPEIFGINAHIRDLAEFYAEEGYVVLAPDLFWRLERDVELGYEGADREKALDLMKRFDLDQGVRDIGATVAAARAMPEVGGCDGGKAVGAVGFCLGGRLAYLAAARCGVDAAVGYYGGGIEKLLDEADRIACPLTLHFGGADRISPPEVIEKIRAAFAGRPDVEVFVYPQAGHAFNRPGPHFDKPAALMAHSRSIAMLRNAMGPHYDLSALWDKHCEYEFATRDVDATMSTMVAEPYVNHIPTMTGGYGYKQLHRFYSNHFVHGNPADTKLIPISRTVGADRVVDEMLFCFTHDREIDWMLPGIPPTGRYVEIPLIAIINFRGDKLYNEHIYWDQASVLVQIGALKPDGLPVAGVETARKLVDPALPSNTLMARWTESDGS
ncbi:dienelactone hydrolase family protein (plasmid) [Skermanella rosea]|uniref:dienelactone hydrolase family protein n=1 Tax=Skermanella rosea TaxID=1817965 RepID=UPI0019341157|nr:dienelactone hydrolase family protein [Skermanella rosea]UEM06852.1 dienelactone hydrolase family protein [Skermanella rosea]